MTNKIKNGVPDAWSTVPWLTSHRIGAHDRSLTDSTEQARSEQTPAGIADARPREAKSDKLDDEELSSIAQRAKE